MSFEPLRVRVYGTREGILMDLSEGGALVQFPAALPRDKEITLNIEWKTRTLELQTRVVRCTQRRVELESAMLARMEYHVALEFGRLPPDTATAIRQILAGQ
jgi:hypothetical protein